MVEVDSDTVETHFALGSLFRRRGEVDRAIRIHQNLIARPALSRSHRLQALHELGEDYMRAGLFDRAESLFSELAESGTYMGSALRHLMAIYEQQSDWDQAIAAAQRLESVEGTPQRRTISHYWCEMAELALDSGNHKRTAQMLKRARSADPDNVRADLLAGTLADAEDDPAAAIQAYKRVVERDAAFVGEVLTQLQSAFRRHDGREDFDSWLAQLRERQPQSIPAVAMAVFCKPALSGKEATEFVRRFLETRGQGLAQLLERLVDQRSLHPDMELDASRAVVRVLLEDHPRYLCTNCGFTGNTLYWQCPGCRSWGAVKPAMELPYPPTASALPEGTGRP
jgi:lipopolysaccharide assembly protein B